MRPTMSVPGPGCSSADPRQSSADHQAEATINLYIVTIIPNVLYATTIIIIIYSNWRSI